MDRLDRASFRDWIPAFVRNRGSESTIEWVFHDDRLSHPFYEETIALAKRRPFNALFARRTGIDVAAHMNAAGLGIPPTGFVFHMSRCGSTLVAQMLAARPAARVLSEPQPIDAILRARGDLVSIVGVLARPAAGERECYVKFSPWHALALPAIEAAFPGVPWAFVFREPRAVLASHERLPSADDFTELLEPSSFEAGSTTAGRMPSDEYRARAIAAVCDAALRAGARPHARALFIAYDELPQAVPERLLPFFGVEPDPGDAERMRAASGRDTKSSGRRAFVAPRADRVSPEIDELAARHLDDRYAALRRAAAAR